MNTICSLICRWGLVAGAMLIVAEARLPHALAAPPKVVKAEPDNGEKNVDPELEVIRIEFDQDMSAGGFSICGGQGLEVTGKPRWASKRVFELPVKLAPGQTYEFSVNCPSAKNFQSAAGESAKVYPIKFKTAAGAAPGGAPKVIKATPDNGDEDVDPKLKRIRIEFDQDMSAGGFSICGGQGLEITGKPRWASKRVFEMPVKLKPDQTYEFSVNCPNAKNFKSAAGTPAEIYPITFKTLAPGAEPAPPPSAEEKQTAIERLRKAIDERYSYRDLRGVDWEARFKEFGPRMEASRSWSEFGRHAVELLSAAQDPHIWLTLGDRTAGTFRRDVEPNFNAQQLPQLVPGWKLHNRMVATGQFDDGIGYIMIANWSPKSDDDMAPIFAALKQFADAPGIILDVRPNGGGSEPAAQKVAGCFLREPAVYARNSYRDPAAPGGFGQVYDRQVQPAEPAVTAPVAVLMGPVNMSSCESFLSMMDQSPQATLIGTPSYGSSGNPKPHELGGGLVVYLPSWKDMLPDGTLLEGHGLEPDIAVEADAADFATADPVLVRALEHLRTKPADGN